MERDNMNNFYGMPPYNYDNNFGNIFFTSICSK